MKNTIPSLIVGCSTLGIFVHFFITIIRGEIEAKKLLKNLIRDKLEAKMLLSCNEKIILQGSIIFFVEEDAYKENVILEKIEIIKFSKIGWGIKVSPWLQAKNPWLYDYFRKFI